MSDSRWNLLLVESVLRLHPGRQTVRSPMEDILTWEMFYKRGPIGSRASNYGAQTLAASITPHRASARCAKPAPVVLRAARQGFSADFLTDRRPPSMKRMMSGPEALAVRGP